MKMLKTALTASAAFAALGLASAASADQVFNDDVIVDGSLCVGFDCANGENFGFDTLRLKENNTRIAFVDTSTTGGFPSEDWELTANDSANGGRNMFAIQNTSLGREMFTIVSPTQTHALYLTGNKVGLGTNTPAVELHIADGDSPTVRLEQDGSSGFTPQTWDLAGNEANFFVRDVTNGSQLPLRIFPGADSNSLTIAADNDIGIGAQNADASLEVQRNNGTAQILVDENSGTKAKRDLIFVSNNGNPQIAMENTANGNVWFLGAGNSFVIEHRGSGTRSFEMEPNGDLEIQGTLTTGGGTCGGGCDLVFTEDYELPTIEEHAEMMWERGFLPNVGPTEENAPINVSDKLGRMLNELETAHIYIDQLNSELTESTDQVAALEARLDRLEAALEQ